MKRLLTMTMLLITPLTAKAQWKDLPLGTNHYDWNVLRTNSNPIRQLWYACVERYQAFPSAYPRSTNPPNIIANMTVTKWYSNLVTNVVSGSITNTYTNKIPITQNIQITNNLWRNEYTTFVESVEVIWTNQNDVVCTNDAYWFLSENNGAILDAPFFNIFSRGYSENPGSADRACVGFFVKTNESSNATFDAWFARTNGLGVRPTTFPKTVPDIFFDATAYADAVAVFRAELGTNYAFLRTNDSWGVEHGRGQGEDMFRFSRHTTARTAHLAEIDRTDDAWGAFRAYDDISGNNNSGAYQYYELQPFKIASMMPVITYLTTNAVPVSSTVSVSGRVATAWENHVKFDSTFYTNAYETRTLTGTNTVLSNFWVKVDSITIATNNTVWGDTVAVQYTNGLMLWNSFYFGDESGPSKVTPHELKNSDFDERQKVLNALVWANANCTWSGVRNYWEGTSTSSWSDAKSVCETNQTVVDAASTLSPRAHTSGTYIGSVWRAYGEAIMSSAIGTLSTQYVSSARSTNYAHAADYYVAVAMATEWDAQGSSYSSNGYCSIFTDMTTTNQWGYSCTSSVTVGANAFPPTWCDEPFTGTNKQKGYIVNEENCLIRFDVPGGFAYK